MKTLVVLTFELGKPDDIVAVMRAIDPPSLPMFTGTARIAVDPQASHVEEWLDADDE